MKVHVEPDDIVEAPTDSRGRIYLGAELADRENVEIAVLDRGERKDGEGDG